MLDSLIGSSVNKREMNVYKFMIGEIIKHDYPSAWPDCFDTVLSKLVGSKKIYEIQGCLIALEKIFEKYKLEIDNRQILEHIFTRSIVALLNLSI